MLEFYNESLSKSSVLHGAEDRMWKQLVDDLDLMDLYLCASHRRGPLFTRQATSSDRTDAARLDRMYGSHRGKWFHHVDYIDHDCQQSLLDHIPVVAQIALKEPLLT